MVFLSLFLLLFFLFLCEFNILTNAVQLMQSLLSSSTLHGPQGDISWCMQHAVSVQQHYNFCCFFRQWNTCNEYKLNLLAAMTSRTQNTSKKSSLCKAGAWGKGWKLIFNIRWLNAGVVWIKSHLNKPFNLFIECLFSVGVFLFHQPCCCNAEMTLLRRAPVWNELSIYS